MDDLTIEFVSFSENKINKKLVLEFLMTLIMKRKEIIINEVILKQILLLMKHIRSYQIGKNYFLDGISSVLYSYPRKGLYD